MLTRVCIFCNGEVGGEHDRRVFVWVSDGVDSLFDLDRDLRVRVDVLPEGEQWQRLIVL